MTLVPDSPHESARLAADPDILRALLDKLRAATAPMPDQRMNPSPTDGRSSFFSIALQIPVEFGYL